MKKLLALLLALLLMLSVSGCGGAPTPTATPIPEPEFDFESYKGLVLENVKAISAEVVLLGNTGLYQYNYWKALENLGGKFDREDLVTRGKKWLSENANIREDSIDLNYDAIWFRDRDVRAFQADGVEAEEITKYYAKLLDFYDHLYRLITNPPGSIGTFLRSLDDYFTGAKNYSDMLLVLLEGTPND